MVGQVRLLGSLPHFGFGRAELRLGAGVPARFRYVQTWVTLRYCAKTMLA